MVSVFTAWGQLTITIGLWTVGESHPSDSPCCDFMYENGEKTAARSVVVFQVLLGFAFVLAFLRRSELKCSQDNWKSPLSHTKQFCPSLVPRYTASSVTSYLCEQMKILHWHLLLHRRITQGKGILLLCCGDVEPNLEPAALDNIRDWKKET